MADYAKGIPDKSNYGNTESLTPGSLVRWVVQQHLADKAGPHTDIRLGNKDTGLLSWASRKGLPEIGKKHLAVQQPLHDYDYGSFEGKINKGYGKGDVKLQDLGEALITKADPNSIHFTTAHTGTPTRYMLHNTGYGKDGRGWLMQNLTPNEMPDYEKKHYKNVPIEKIEELIKKLPSGSSVQPKIDGSAILLSLKDKLEAQSYRQSKRTNGPITHTEKVFGSIPDLKQTLPKDLKGSLLRGELYGLDKHTSKVIHPATLGGLLNSSISKSLKDQKEKNIDLKTVLFDIERHGKNKIDWNTPYKDRMKLLESIMPYLPKDKIHLPEQATNPEDVKKLLNTIKSHEHPLSQEGIVIHPETGRPIKSKLFDDFDVLIKSIFPGEGKYKDTHAGGFEYSDKEDGKTLGRVGTGFSDEIRKHMHEHPEEYIGRTARVTSQEKMRSGALRAPAFWDFVSLHEDKPTGKSKEENYVKSAQSQIDRYSRERNRTLDSTRASSDTKQEIQQLPMQMRMRYNKSATQTSSNQRRIEILRLSKIGMDNSSTEDSWLESYKRVCGMVEHGIPMHFTKINSVQTLWRKRNNNLFGMGEKLFDVPIRYGTMPQESNLGEKRCEWQLQSEQLYLDNASRTSKESTTNKMDSVQRTEEVSSGLVKNNWNIKSNNNRKIKQRLDDRTYINNHYLMKASSLEELLSRRADDNWKPRVRVMLPTGPNTYLLEKLMNKKYPQNLGKLRFPGGGVDPGETMQEAAVREMQEELKYKLDPSKLEYVGQDSRPTHNYEHYFKLLNHGLKPGKYIDAVGGDSTVYLTRKRPQGDKYFGADVSKLVKPTI